jgi:hypothetical protein
MKKLSPRQIAIQNGDTHYEGILCKIGLHTTKYTGNGGCVECHKQFVKSPDQKNKGKQWRQKNKEKVQIDAKQYRQKNKERLNASNRQYKLVNKEKLKAIRDSPEGRIKRSVYRKTRYYNDPVYRAKTLLSSLLRNFCKQLGSSKGGKTLEELLGYTAEELKIHLESLFKEGMTWDNQGDWHIDHIIPQSHFTSIDQMRECFALSNLKPEWGSWNMSKGNRFVGSSEEFPMPTKAA